MACVWGRLCPEPLYESCPGCGCNSVFSLHKLHECLPHEAVKMLHLDKVAVENHYYRLISLMHPTLTHSHLMFLPNNLSINGSIEIRQSGDLMIAAVAQL